MSPENEPQAIRIVASDHLAAIRPRVEQRLTARFQLRRGHLRSLPLASKGGEEPRAQAGLPWRGVFSLAQGR